MDGFALIEENRIGIGGIVVLFRFVALVEPAHLVATARHCIASRAGGDPPLEAGLAIYRHHHALIVFIDRDEERRRLRNADKLCARCAHGKSRRTMPNVLAQAINSVDPDRAAKIIS
jgi:hypothetical protein